MTAGDPADPVGAMEATISGIQDEMATKLGPPARSRRPWWLALMATVALVVGAGAYITATQLRETPGNAQAAEDENCQVRNEKILALNEKFAEVAALFDFVLASRAPGAGPPSAEALRALADLKTPVAPAVCE